MSTIPRDADGCFHPTTEEELCALVAEANAQKKQLRVLGSTHSVWRAIVTDNFNGAQTPSNEMPVVLDRYIKIFEPKPDPKNPSGKLVEVQAGCHLGISPERPVQGRIDPRPAVSDVMKPSPWHDGSWEASFTSVLHETYGLALSDLGGISHQTVAGFLSTGSAGGTLKWSVHEAIAALRVIDGQGNAKTLTADGDDAEWFRAAGVGLGVCGVISTVTFRCEPTFDIVGQEASSIATLSPDMDFYGNRPDAKLPSLEKFLIETDYARIMWWPQYQFDRLVTWQASRSVYDPNRVLKPYSEIGGLPVLKQFGISIVYTLLACADDPAEARRQLAAIARHPQASPEAFAALKGWKPKPQFASQTAPADPRGCLQGVIDLLTQVKRDPVTMGDAWVQLVELLATGSDQLVELLAKLPFFDWLIRGIGEAMKDHIAELLGLFIGTGPNGTATIQTFEDRSYMGLPMDNQMDDLLFPTWFTELWVPFTPGDGKLQDTITRLRKYFDADGTSRGAFKATGGFAFELYVGKKDDTFFMSPAAGSHVFRVDAFWYAKNLEDPVKTFFPPLWDVLNPLGFRAHWGKFQPAPGSINPPMISRYPDAARFKAVRARVDPNNVFLTSYWKQHLGLE